MLIKKSQIPILITNIIYLIIFLFYYIRKLNYEFIIYVAVILFFLGLIIATNKKVNYPDFTLWGMTLWGFMHMAGGSIRINSEILYKLILIPINTNLFRYDQLVHIIGFCVATLIMYHIIKPHLKTDKWVAVSIVIIMAGLGVGALNEIIEFIAVLLIPETNVGGYINTSLDLVADLIGAVIAMVIIRVKNKIVT